MKGYVRVKYLKICGAPVYIHWAALVVLGGLFGISLNDPLLALITMCSYFGIILLHESGHAYFARIFDCRPIKINLGVIHGLCEYEASNEELHNLIITWGGVIAQLVVAIPLIVLAQTTDISKVYGMGPIIVCLGYISFLMALVNLAPSKGLDGEYAWKLIPFLLKTRSQKNEHNIKLKNRYNRDSPEKVVDEFINKMKKEK